MFLTSSVLLYAGGPARFIMGLSWDLNMVKVYKIVLFRLPADYIRIKETRYKLGGTPSIYIYISIPICTKIPHIFS